MKQVLKLSLIFTCQTLVLIDNLHAHTTTRPIQNVNMLQAVLTAVARGGNSSSIVLFSVAAATVGTTRSSSWFSRTFGKERRSKVMHALLATRRVVCLDCVCVDSNFCLSVCLRLVYLSVFLLAWTFVRMRVGCTPCCRACALVAAVSEIVTHTRLFTVQLGGVRR